MPRLSITLTDSQAAALDRIAAETGATKQSMIGLAISAWIRDQHADGANWYGWCRTYTDEDGTQDIDRRAYATEHDAIMHAKAVAAECKAKGHTAARPMWERCR